MTRKDGKSIWVSPETKALLTTYAQSKKIAVKVILDLVIPQVVEHDLYDPFWIDKIKAAKRRVEIRARMGDACAGLAYGVDANEKDVFRCVWYRIDGPPKIRLLGKTESLQESACAGCDRTKEIVMELVSRGERIIELEEDLKARASEVYKVPICNAGAILGHDKEDQLLFRGCKRSPRVPVSVEKYCKVLRGGTPCYMYATTVIAVGDGKSKTEMKK